MSYPRIEIDLKKLYHNSKYIYNCCNKRNINLSGVIKGANGSIEVAKVFKDSGYKHIASSRLRELIPIKENNLNIETMLIRIPMISEIPDLIDYVDISLNSELDTILKIENECAKKNKTHNVILMFDLGDLREGYFFESEILKAAKYIENELNYVKLYGIGTNVSCYGSVVPTVKNLNKLSDVATKIESEIDRELDIISGGATTTLPLLFNNKLPSKINNLRVGEGVLMAADLEDFWGLDLSNMYNDSFILKAEIIEIKTKPSHPIGELFIDAFGNKPTYEDIGDRKRALLAIGKKDIEHHSKLISLNDNLKIIGSSSDHLIIDIEDVDKNYKIGDIISFRMYYPAMLLGCASRDVYKKYININYKK